MNIIELKKGTESLDAFKWVAKAKGKDQIRKVLTILCVEKIPDTEEYKRLVVATDGRRLHVAKFDGDCEPGNYRIIHANQSYMFLCADTDGMTYPKWQGVVPKYVLEQRKKIGFYKL